VTSRQRIGDWFSGDRRLNYMAIVPMKKMLFVTLARDGKSFLRKLQSMGVLHPEHIREAIESEDLSRLEHKLHVQRTVIRSLETREKGLKSEGVVPVVPKVLEVEKWIEDEKRFRERLSRVKRDIQKQIRWGNFDPADFKILEENGVLLQLWDVDSRQFRSVSLPEGVSLHVMSKDSVVSFVTVTKGLAIELENADSVQLPEQSLDELQRDHETLLRQIDSVSRQIDAATAFLSRFKDKNLRLEEERDYYETLDRAFEDESVMAFTGWVPAGDVDSVKHEIIRSFETSFVKLRDPAPEEIPPVKTKNPWVVCAFEPLLHLLGFPKYRGVDPALFFAPSMMLFFGICLGDAGYGVVMIIASFLMRRFLVKKIRGMLFVSNMTLLFGILTVMWGLMTGTIFGIAFSDRGWIFLDVSPGSGDPMLLFKISIGLGIIHLTIAFFIALFHARTISIRLSKLGLVMVLWGGTLGVLKVPYWWLLMASGASLILLFSSESKNPFARIGFGLWSLYGLSGLLGDVMSYARLFGLGIASGAIASVVNMLAGDVRGAVPAIGDILAILVLLVGHSFNFCIGIIGALVHPARLHAVEAFPKCVQLTGVPYKPLARQ